MKRTQPCGQCGVTLKVKRRREGPRCVWYCSPECRDGWEVADGMRREQLFARGSEEGEKFMQGMMQGAQGTLKII